MRLLVAAVRLGKEEASQLFSSLRTKAGSAPVLIFTESQKFCGRRSTFDICATSYSTTSKHSGFNRAGSVLRSALNRTYRTTAHQSSAETADRLSFRPTRFYQRRLFATGESYAFWGLTCVTLGIAACAHQDLHGASSAVLEYGRASVDNLYSGKYYTLLSSTLCHSNLIHFGLNTFWLVAYRHFQPLNGSKFLGLYLLGGVAGACSHVAYYWYHAGGLDFGEEYSRNTPAYMGSSAGIASVLTYKLVQNPFGSHRVLFVPLPVVAMLALYLMLDIKQEVYLDGIAAKGGGAAFGALVGIVTRIMLK